MDYSSKTLQVTPAAHRLRTHVYALGNLLAPVDIKLGYLGTVWFSAGGNCIGRLDGNRQLEVFPRQHGRGVHVLSPGVLGGIFYFTDPLGDSIGSITHEGVYRDEIATGPGTRPTCMGGGGARPVMVGLAAGASIFRCEPEVDVQRIDTPHRGIGAVHRRGDGGIWYMADGGIRLITASGQQGGGCQLPPGAYSERFVERSTDGAVFYCDTARDVVGCIRDDWTVIEYLLPAGTAPRAIECGNYRKLWFTGSGGRALYCLDDRMETLTSHQCADESADLTRMALEFGSEGTIWFTETGRNRISSAHIEL